MPQGFLRQFMNSFGEGGVPRYVHEYAVLDALESYALCKCEPAKGIPSISKPVSSPSLVVSSLAVNGLSSCVSQ